MNKQVADLPLLDDFKKLPQENISEFREKGHTLVKDVLSAGEIASYRPVIVEAADRYNTEKRKLDDRDTYGKAFLQIMNLWRVDDDVKKFVLGKRMAKIAADLMGVENVRIYHDQALFKEPSGGPPFNKFENFTDEDWTQAFELTLKSFARLSRSVLPYMKAAGSGRIINIISGSVKSVLSNSVLSTSMRMGVVGMAKLLADELGPYHITVNNVAPGMILTDRLKHTLPKDADPEQALKDRAKNIPLGRIGKPEELAALVAFLASGQAAYISGTTIQVDGGANRGIL